MYSKIPTMAILSDGKLQLHSALLEKYITTVSRELSVIIESMSRKSSTKKNIYIKINGHFHLCFCLVSVDH